MMYLSWSIWFLSVVLVANTLIWFVIYQVQKTVDKKKLKYRPHCVVFSYVLVLFNAFNVGQMQNDIDRSSFNNKFETLETLEVQTKQSPDRNSVESKFNQTIKNQENVE